MPSWRRGGHGRPPDASAERRPASCREVNSRVERRARSATIAHPQCGTRVGCCGAVAREGPLGPSPDRTKACRAQRSGPVAIRELAGRCSPHFASGGSASRRPGACGSCRTGRSHEKRQPGEALANTWGCEDFGALVRSCGPRSASDGKDPDHHGGDPARFRGTHGSHVAP